MSRCLRVLVAASIVTVTSFVLLASPIADAQSSASNPLDPTRGYLVFVEGNGRLGSGDIEGTAAIGGQLQMGGQFTIATQTTNPPATGDPRPTALYVADRIDFVGSSSGARLNVNQGFAKIATIANAALFGGSPAGTMQIVAAGGNAQTTPQVNVNASQPQSSVTVLPQPPIDFGSAFTTLRTSSTSLAACTVSGVRLTDANGTTTYDPANIPRGVQVYVHLTNNQTNVLNLTVQNLLNVGSFTFRDAPNSSRPFVVNVDVSTTPAFTWAVQNQAGTSGTTAPFTLWNFVGTSTITLQGGDSLNGTFFGPGITLSDTSPNNIQGNVVAHLYDQGPGQTQGGEVHNFPFRPSLSGCTPPPPVMGSLLVKKSISGPGAGSQGPITLEIHCTPPNAGIPNFTIPAGLTGTVTTIVTGITLPAVCEAVEVATGQLPGVVAAAAPGLHSQQAEVCPAGVQSAGVQAAGVGAPRQQTVPSIALDNVIDTTSTSSTTTSSTTTSSTTTSSTTTSSTTTTTAGSTTTTGSSTTTTAESTTTTAGSTTTTAGSTTTSAGPTTTTAGSTTTAAGGSTTTTAGGSTSTAGSTTTPPTTVAPTTAAPTTVVSTTEPPPIVTTAPPCVLPTSVSPTDQLPATGNDDAPLGVLLATAFGASGLALIVVSRRRLTD